MLPGGDGRGEGNKLRRRRIAQSAAAMDLVINRSRPSSDRRSSAARSWIQMGESGIHGRGVYARVSIPDGTRVIEYSGERITKAEACRRERQRLERQRAGGDGCVYIFELNRKHDLDGRRHRNIARLINHSCAPNCRAETIRGRIWIIARRDISVGEEL